MTHESGVAMNGHIEAHILQTEPDTSGQGQQGQEMEDELPESSPAPLVNGSIVDVNELSTGENVVKDEDTSDLLEETKQDEIKNEPSDDQLEDCIVQESVITVEKTEDVAPQEDIENENDVECVSDEIDSTNISATIVDNQKKDVEIVASNWGIAGELSESKAAVNVEENDASLILNRNAAFLTEVPPLDDEDENITEPSKETLEKETDEESFVMLEKVPAENEDTSNALNVETKTDETDSTDVVNDTSHEELNTGASDDITTEEISCENNDEDSEKIKMEEEIQVTKPLLTEQTPIVAEETEVTKTTLIDTKPTSKSSKEVEKINKKTGGPEMKIPLTISLPITFGVGLILYFIFGKKHKA